MADAGDSKSPGLYAREGSTPSSGTKQCRDSSVGRASDS